MTDNIQKINAKSVFKYMFLPGIIPRAKELGGSGFGYLAFLFAFIYQAVRLLPANHPYTKAENIGKFTIRQAISAAANNLEFKRGNIDQVIVFFAILVGVVLLILQFALFLITIFSGQAFAGAGGGAPFKSIFKTENPETDIAFMLLDYTFGIPKVFNSNALAAGPTAFHEALHVLFQFYNLAILLVGVLIFLYYIIVVVIETAQTGVPFGRRFAKIYAPLRLIIAIGLLVPLPTAASGDGGSSGAHFNAAQYITLYAAKLGSSFATNGWILYNRELRNPLGVDNASLVARANVPEILGLLHFSSVYAACRQMYDLHADKNYLDTGEGGAGDGAAGGAKTIQIKPYVIVDNVAEDFFEYEYETAKEDFKSSNIEVILGEKDDRHATYAGKVYPYCGKMTISLSNDNPGFFTGDKEAGGVRIVEKAYYNFARRLLKDDSKFAALGERSAYFHITGEKHDACHRKSDLGDGDTCETKWLPAINGSELQGEIENFKTVLEEEVKKAYEDLQKNMDVKLSEEMEKRGWGGAGIWYNNIAQVNGSLTAAIYSIPEVRKYPDVAGQLISEKQSEDTAMGESCRIFEPNLAGGRSSTWRVDVDSKILQAINDVYKHWACSKAEQEIEGGLATGMTGNAVLDVIGAIFGINGLYHLKENSKADEATGMPIVHPMASLSAIGKSLVENAIRNIGTSIVFTAFGGLVSGLSGSIGGGLNTLSGMFVSIATIGLTAGFVLYYILPFLPFLYFFFAVGSWVKSIFEAMVGVPLWALAHLKIDGDGLSGRAASQGYFLILEIFIRPIATVFGLIGGMAIFGAMVAVLNSVFDLVVVNITGDTGIAPTDPAMVDPLEEFKRSVIDQFFFTIMYALLVYLMATSCFKMIDMVPKAVMRWIGSGVSTFNDNTSDPTQNLTQYTAIAGSQFIGPIVGGVNSGVRGVSGLMGQLIKGGVNPKEDQGGN